MAIIKQELNFVEVYHQTPPPEAREDQMGARFGFPRKPAARTIRSLVALLTDALAKLDAATATINQSSLLMIARASLCGSRCIAMCDDVITDLAAAHTRVHRMLQAQWNLALKRSDERAEEADAACKLLAACAAMCDEGTSAAPITESISGISSLLLSFHGFCASCSFPVCTLSFDMVAGMSSVWRDLIDGHASELGGRGIKSFVKGAAGSTFNEVYIHPHLANGALAEYVRPDDVSVELSSRATGVRCDALVTVTPATQGRLRAVYTVAQDCADRIQLSFMVCGVSIGVPLNVRSDYCPVTGTRLVTTFHFGSDNEAIGFAVNANASWLVVSYPASHQLRLFSITTPTRIKYMRSIGEEGAGPAQFKFPRRLCITADDSLLVCDSGNNRVQHLTSRGKFIRAFTVRTPFSIAIHSRLVAVGTSGRTVEVRMYRYPMFEHLRSFSSDGVLPGCIGWCPTALLFTQGGRSLVVAEYGNSRLSLFTAGGEFVRCICTGVLDKGIIDVCTGAGDELIVSDFRNHRVCVFSPDGGTLVAAWGTHGRQPGQLDFTSALAVSGSYLFVLDYARIQVFE